VRCGEVLDLSVIWRGERKRSACGGLLGVGKWPSGREVVKG